jgi:endonuclease/exonuclease/phosphatase (EEP) superfamily protein YafD
VTKDLTIDDVHLGPNVGSDHRPLVATIRLPDGFGW